MNKRERKSVVLFLSSMYVFFFAFVMLYGGYVYTDLVQDLFVFLAAPLIATVIYYWFISNKRIVVKR